MGMAMLFAFLSLVCILSLAYRLDHSLATQTIILIGVIFTMFAHSLISLIITFSGDKVKSIMFWTMGSLAGSSYGNALALAAALLVCGTLLWRSAPELNAFAVGEDNARHVGVDVKRVKLRVLIAASVLIGVCVSIGGTIGFVGLVVPHLVRMLVGPEAKPLLLFSALGGGILLLWSDVLARTVLDHGAELPVGVVTALFGGPFFCLILARGRRP